MSKRDAMRLPARSHRVAAGALLALALAACGAPRSRPATGPLADDVRASLASGTGAFDHIVWNDLLADAVRDDRLDYALLATRRGDLDDYLDALASSRLAGLASAELEALLINAYNALTVAAILDHPEVTSIRDIAGVWDRAEHVVGSHRVTLDEIEHNVLRPFFRDPRIHFAVNCASASCAPLPPWAFTGPELDRQLDARARAFLTDPRNVRIEQDRLLLSRYFDWYGGDFVAPDFHPHADSLAAFVARFATPEVAAEIASRPDLEVDFLDYDWSLNAATRAAPAGSG